jgi:hypothetical protein
MLLSRYLMSVAINYVLPILMQWSAAAVLNIASVVLQNAAN